MHKHPQLLELNAFFFVSRMSEQYGRPLTLATIPDEAWRSFADQGFHYVWLMGVWERSPGSREHAQQEPNLVHAYDLILPGWKKEDVTGSPYAIYDYELDPYLGRTEDLLLLKRKLNGMGLGLILDFVPNHLAFDHPWTVQHPERFVTCTKKIQQTHPEWFFSTPGGNKLAHGRDPFFPAWIDTVQVNFWSDHLRKIWLETLLKIARLADGVRCDMAMLALNDIFQKVWGGYIVEQRPSTEFWNEIIPRVKQVAPHFIFIAEVYWDLDWSLQQLGFDFTYDKRLYDRLYYDSPVSVRGHLEADPMYADRCLRFIENHDEERAVVNFGRKKSQAAGIIMATIPGLRFFHDGQLEGRRIRTPVHLRREPPEPVDIETRDLYQKLLRFIRDSVTHDGAWELLRTSPAWDKNETYQGIIAWLWHQNHQWKFVAINYSMIRSQAFIRLSEQLKEKPFIQFRDVLTDKIYDRTGGELVGKGFYVDLQPWQAHLFDFVV